MRQTHGCFQASVGGISDFEDGMIRDLCEDGTEIGLGIDVVERGNSIIDRMLLARLPTLSDRAEDQFYCSRTSMHNSMPLPAESPYPRVRVLVLICGMTKEATPSAIRARRQLGEQGGVPFVRFVFVAANYQGGHLQ